MYQHADIVKKLRARRLRLAVRDRRLGRPKTRWADLVAEDVKKLRISNWRTQALDRATLSKLC